MPNALLDRLRADWNTLRSQIEQIQTSAADADRDLDDAEQANVDDLIQRAEQLRPRIEHLVEQEASFSATADALSRVTTAGGALAVKREESTVEVLRSMYPDAGHYVADLMRAGRHINDREAGARIARAQEIARALANQVTADNPGILPTPIVGEVINVLDASRPVWASFTQRPMPQSGKTFQRPYITQHTLVGKQTAEKTQVATQKMTVTPISLTKETYAGALDISVQDVDWTDPSILQIVLQDLADQYAIQLDAAASALLAAVTQTEVLAVGATPQALMTALYNAAGKVYAGGKTLPNALWAAPDMWAKLGAYTDTTGRPLFSGLAPGGGEGADATTFAGNPLGLQLVVGPNLPVGTMVMGASKYAEAYEDRRGAVRAFEVSLLGWEIGFYGYAVAVLTQPTAFVKFTTV